MFSKKLKGVLYVKCLQIMVVYNTDAVEIAFQQYNILRFIPPKELRDLYVEGINKASFSFCTIKGVKTCYDLNLNNIISSLFTRQTCSIQYDEMAALV